MLTTGFAHSTSPNGDLVWFWFGNCANSTVMGVKVVVDGQTVYRSSFRACQMERTDANTKNEQSVRAFHFSGGHTFQDTYRTTENEKVEGNIWQAGADPDAILLGVSFVAHNQVLLNTIHVVKPGKPAKSILDRDVFIKTYPLASEEHSGK
jgi:hypothetical protein